MNKQTHTTEVVNIHAQILAESPAEGRTIALSGGQKIHVIEAGEGPPLVFLHGTAGPAHLFVPLLEHLAGVRTMMPDRPGNGLSDPVDRGDKGFREWAVQMTDQILTALGVDEITLAGVSAGGTWAIWYALAHPDRIHRLILLGAVPLLPGTRPPLPVRLLAAPVIGNIMARLPASEQTMTSIMGVFGEKETIVRYPKQLQALAAGNNDPVASRTDRAELAALMTLGGFRKDMRIKGEELARLNMPTLIIWGKDDPLGGEEVARNTSEAIPNSQLELLPAGHIPSLGYPEKTASLIQDFVLAA
jgi:pimeloyl-ACP methyl ester carboxylesterase